MTWGFVGATAVGVAGGAYASNRASSAAKDAARREGESNAAYEARMTEAYNDARVRHSPFMGSEQAANQQLMIEMGLTPPAQTEAYNVGYTAEREKNIADLEQQIAALERGETIDHFSGGSGWTSKALRRGLATALRSQLDSETSLLESPPPPTGQAQTAQPQGQPGTAYMNTPGYQGAIDEGVRAVNTGAANSGSLYSGARGLALRDVGQGVQQSFYNNYMNILQNMANPTATTNVSNIGIGQAGNIGAQNIASTNRANEYRLAGTEAKNSFIADAAGGLGSAFEAYINRTPPPPDQIDASQNTRVWV